MPLFTSDSNVTISLPPVAFDPMVWTQTAKQLKLKYLAEHPDVAAELLRAGLPADAAALHILRLECQYRAGHKTAMNMSMAKFPGDEKSYLCGLCFLNILPGIFSGMWPPISMP